jgi:hypothetical protein
VERGGGGGTAWASFTVLILSALNKYAGGLLISDYIVMLISDFWISVYICKL